MQIIVEGIGSKYVTPDEVILNIKIKVLGKNYEEALNLGSKFMDKFTSNVLLTNTFNKEDLKTRSFIIKEEQEYNEITRKYEINGFSYNQNCILKFDYDIIRLSKILNDISKLNDNLSCKIDFSIKNEEKIRKEVIKLAYKDAEEKAEMVAKASKKKLIDCVKVDFKPFESDVLSETNLELASIYNSRSISNPIDALSNSFTPEDIEIKEIIYCMWNAEK